MFSVSSPKGRLKLSITTTDLLVVFILTLYVTDCEARRDLRVHGNKHCSSKLTSSPPKGVIDGAAGKGNVRSSSEIPVGSKVDASMLVNEGVTTAAKKEVASSGDSCRGSLSKAVEAIKVRPSIGERSLLGADGSNSELVGSNMTAAYTAETLVAMDYLDAHPAPAVHNR
ncbi:hypothetical protein BDA96_04G310800 [Sorghum bicolor]|uniref:Uncharacterized protein n=2 Tax=Sorghum bicolor TaxID=4558 RepID=A0A921R7F7_SORBI|nr:hypothetical protein BDA96_04G310800 [Sorghum bicolor]OQU85683.1 hypothetical protein SORBI_3004G291300 [Sorghum bicolor]